MSQSDSNMHSIKITALAFAVIAVIGGVIAIMPDDDISKKPLGDIELRITGNYPAFPADKCATAMNDSFPQYYPVVAGCAVAGNPIAMRTLGYRAYLGINDTPRDETSSLAWLKRAAAVGDEEAKRIIKSIDGKTMPDDYAATLRREAEKTLDCKRFPEIAYSCGNVLRRDIPTDDHATSCKAHLEGDGVTTDYHKAAVECTKAAEKDPTGFSAMKTEALRLREWHERSAPADGENLAAPDQREIHYRKYHAAVRAWKKTCVPFSKEIQGCDAMPSEGFYILDMKGRFARLDEILAQTPQTQDIPVGASKIEEHPKGLADELGKPAASKEKPTGRKNQK